MTAKKSLLGVLLASALTLALLVLGATNVGAEPDLTHRSTPTPSPTPRLPRDDEVCRNGGNFWTGSACEPKKTLTHVPVPGCARVEPGGRTLERYGVVTCYLNWFGPGGGQMAMRAAVGCLDVYRNPFPRAMVNLPVKVVIGGNPDTGSLIKIPFQEVGGYKIDPEYAFATLSYKENPDRLRNQTMLGQHPSIMDARFGLRLVMDTSREPLWTFGLPGRALRGGLTEELFYTYEFSSFEYEGAYRPRIGPGKDLANELPSFLVQVRTEWRLHLVLSYQPYKIDEGTNRHVPDGPRVVRSDVPTNVTVTSFRAWDSRQKPDGVERYFCDASPNGFIPVPVIEAQALLDSSP